MITELYIPTIKIKENFDYNKNIDDRTYINMLNKNYAESYNDIDNYMTTGDKGQQNKYTYYTTIGNKKGDEIYEYNKTEASIKDMNGNDLLNETVNSYLSNGDMFVIIVNINPDTINEDTESELIFWIKESMKINNSPKINDDKKISILPKRDLKIKINNIIATLLDCKIIDVYSNPNNGKFNFAILIKKIIN